MHFQSKFRPRSAAAQGFHEPACCRIESGNNWPGAACSRVKFLERHQATLTNVPHHVSKTLGWIVLVHEDEAANNRVEWTVKVHFPSIARFENNVVNVASDCSCSGPLYRCRRSINAYHIAIRAD